LKYRAALCRCGKSKNKPFCDNSHEEAGFKDYGAIGDTGDGFDSQGGELAITPKKDGPLLINGKLTLISGSGRTAWRGEQTALCRCGESANKPFCDGAHKKAGFKSD
jgi:CDGSH-type Zn-finger protein